MDTNSNWLILAIMAILALLIGYLTGQAAPIAESTFDTGDEGWLVVSTEGYVGSPDWSPTEGNPGGVIYDTDMDGGGWGFLAPSKFLGPVGHAYGHTLSFDFATDRPENEYASVALADVNGVGIIAQVPIPSSAYQWCSRELILDETENWNVYNYVTGQEGGTADATDIQNTLSNLGYLFLGAEFANGYDNDGTYQYGELVAYDNIVLQPEPTALLLLAVGGLLAVRRKR
jgi:hypothetical protein